jgi:hypothetical protein
MPPPKQKPFIPSFAASTFGCSPSHAASALKSSTWRCGSVPPPVRSAGTSAGSAMEAVPPSRESRSGATATYPWAAQRRATSRMCGLSPRFSWQTITAG